MDAKVRRSSTGVVAACPRRPTEPARKRAQTVARLIEAANAVITEKGFQSASMDEIAARAGVKAAGHASFRTFSVILQAQAFGLFFQHAISPELVTNEVIIAAFEALAEGPESRSPRAWRR
jgi:hypothetical protein